MQGVVVVNADTDQRGTQKENIFLALDRHGERLGSALIYPFFDPDIEPEHPHNLYLHLQAEGDRADREALKDLLLAHALRRAKEIKHEAEQPKTRIYACFFKHQEEETAYFLRQGFVHDEGMLILERHEPSELPHAEAPGGVTIQSWRVGTHAEQQRFIETHRTVFPRHPYTPQRLGELMSLPGWHNFAAWRDTDLVGNIMVLTERESGDTMGCIEDLFVQKPWRQQGIGRALLCIALQHFRNAGIRRVRLELWSANKVAWHLYRGFGFLTIDETEIAVGRYV
jgi:ribosomal protein S18 acetylase RimI-like enzyme